MSAIKKYIGGDIKKWTTFGETNVLPDDLSNANNISVDFGDHASVNSLLFSQQQDIEKLKRNVSWLALHGGGGLGGGGGGGGSSRKASCTITVNGTSKEVSVTEGQTIYVRLSNFKGSSTTVPWRIVMSFDSTEIYAGSKAQGDTTEITIPIAWSVVSRFFEGSGKMKNHLMVVSATYNDVETGLQGSSTLETYVYIPTVSVSLTTRDSYNTDSAPSELTASIAVDTALMGRFRLKVTSTSYDRQITYDSFEFDKSTDHAQFNIENFLDAFKDGGITRYGVYSSTFDLYNDNPSTGATQLVYSTTRRVIVFSDAVDLLISLNGLSPSDNDDDRTQIFDNVKNLFFSFYAFKNGSTEYKYNIFLRDQTDRSRPDIQVFEDDRTASFESTVSINKIINDFITEHRYEVIIAITPTRPPDDMKMFYGYIKCIPGQFSFINYSNDGEVNRLFMMDAFNSILNNKGIAPSLTLTAATSDTRKEGENHPVSTDVQFSQINPRSGLIADGATNMKALRLNDTYLDIDNKFKYTVEEDYQYKVVSTSVQDNKQFTIAICYQTQSYTSNEHVVFSLCNNGFSNQGIVIKNDGIYVKGSKVLTVYGDRVVTVHIVYNNESGESANKWGQDSSYKIYVNGVITFMSETCPFQEKQDGSSMIIQNDNLKISVNGYTSTGMSVRQEQCNCNIFSIEILKSMMNEIDILGSYVNNRIRTTYKDFSPDFSILDTELNKNCCQYDTATHTISSEMYPTVGSERKFVFKNVLLDANGEVPHTNDTEERDRWIAKLSSLSLPIAYIDLKGSSSPSLTSWTFEQFTKKGSELKDVAIDSKFYYWDPKTGQMPLSSDSVELKVQGTSTLEDHIKNLEIKFSSRNESGKVVQDLLFVRNDWIPENSYILKADVVDSSHANNASIGRFINDQFTKDNSFGYGFDEKGIASNNITRSTVALRDNQKWNINPSLKHTVEGFQILLLVRFSEGDFRNLGIYSFNIGRNAARNLGFEHITGITNIDGVAISSITAPAIIEDAIVNTANEDAIFWIENSNSQNFDGISAWTPSTTTITPDPEGEKTGANPDVNCRFWHCQQGTIEDDTKLNQLFETKYHNTPESVYPASINTFNNFVRQISRLPVEGLMKSTALDQSQPQVTGSYVTQKYTDKEGWVRLAEPHTLNGEPLEAADVNTFDPTRMASYYVIGLMFGLIDNFDKNISFRVFGDSKIIADFYDMDTALGLNNAGLEDVTPTVGMKLVTNYRNTLDQDYPQETFDQNQVKEMYSKYSKYLSETYTNKLWLSLDSNSMRAFNGISYSLYSSLWFKLRQYIDAIAKDQGYSSVVDFFVDKYFGSQVNCGTFIYNYDYTMKYLNDYDQTGKKQSENTISKLHGRRIDEVREWLKNHIDFLDSYFFWRGNYTYINGSRVVPPSLESVVAKKVSITSSSNSNQIDIETEHPVVVHSSSTADGDEVGDTLTVDDDPKHIKVSGGGTDKAMALNCSPLLKNFDLVALGAKMFRAQDGAKITFLEQLVLDGLTIVADGIVMDDFVDDTAAQDVNILSKVSMNGTKFSQSFSLDLSKFQFLNVSYVDIQNSTNINNLKFYTSPYDSDTTTQNLKYLNVTNSQIENLVLMNQSYLVLPNVNTCPNLVTLRIQNCNLNNIGGERTALSNYLDINLSVQNSIQDVVIDNTEHVRSILINDCPQFETLTVNKVSALTSLTIDHDPKLQRIVISECPKLKTIKITQCSAFSEIEILSASALTNLNLEYDSSLTALKISEDSVKNISTINLRNVNISGFNFYNDEIKTYCPIIEDPLGHKVLDFSKFESLNTDGITIRRAATGELTADKCSNFQAYRFPNNPDKSYQLLDRNRDDIGIRFTNLKNVYGHIATRSNGELPSGTDLFLSTAAEYKGYPPFLSTLIGATAPATGIDKRQLLSSTIFDKIEAKCPTLAAGLISQDNLSRISSYIVDGFLSCDADGIDEFDTREWATNYTVPSLNFLFEGSRALDEFQLQYLMYRYAISMRTNQASIPPVKNNFHGLANYYPSNGYVGQNIKFPTNTFRFFGKTMDDIRRVFSWSDTMPPSSRYVVNSDLMKWIPGIKTYAGIGNREVLFWNALSGSAASLTALGNIGNNSYYTASAIKALSAEDDGEEHDYGPALISTLTQLKQIEYFTPDKVNFHLSACQFSSALLSCGNSFTNFTSSEIVDFGYMFDKCTMMKKLYNSFGTTTLLIKPSSLAKVSRIEQILFNDQPKYLVEDRITLDNFLNSYDEDSGQYLIRDSYIPEVSLSCTDYTQSMFTAFVNNIFATNTQLTSTDYLLANITIPYKNIVDNDNYTLKLNSNLLKNNTKVQSLQNFMKNVKFRYSLVPEMFSTLTAVTNLYAAFQNVPSFARGIDSCIPYRFFYTGMEAPKTLSIRGTDRISDGIASYADFKNELKNTFIPTSTIEGATSYDWNSLSTGLKAIGVSVPAIFNDVKATYLTGPGYVDLVTELTDYREKCPLVTYHIVEGSAVYDITPGAEPLVKTLSTIYENLSSNLTGWEDHVCGLSTATLTYNVYRRTIANINYCFSGNCNIKPYDYEDGHSLSSEPNEDYNPFRFNYNATGQRLSSNLQRNTFTEDDRWSSNGDIWIWSDVEDDWVINESNYNADHFNATTPELSVLSSNDQQVYDLSGTGAEIIYYNVDSFKRATFVNAESQPNSLVEYMLYKDQVQQFKYICAPDLLRYINPGINTITYLFNQCDYFVNSSAMTYSTDKAVLNRYGITGRIPPCLLHPVPQVKDITGMFKQCYHMTGYQGKKPDSDDICSYLIPADMFKKSTTVNVFKEAFYGTPIKYNPDFATPLNAITIGSSSNGTKISIESMFANCIWCYVESFKQSIFQSKYFNNVNYAFKNTLGTHHSSKDENIRIVSNGATIGTVPVMNVFQSTKFLPTRIKQTYYGSRYWAGDIYVIESKDVARATLTTDVEITPSAS